MAVITIVIGLLLAVLGVGSYEATHHASPTALIPAAFGVALVVLGALSFKAKRRKITMHAAVLVGLIGFLVPAWRLVGYFKDEGLPAVWAQLAMALVCGLFVGLCVHSFINARKRRKA